MSGNPEIETLQEHVNRHIRHVLDMHGGSPTKAAKALHIGRATLYRWLNSGESRKAASGANRDAFTIQESRALRAKVLKEVLTQWITTHNNGKFTRWLTDALEEAGGNP